MAITFINKPTGGICFPCAEYYSVLTPCNIRTDIKFTLASGVNCGLSRYLLMKVVYRGSTAESKYDCATTVCSAISGVTMFPNLPSVNIPIWQDLEDGLWSSSTAIGIYMSGNYTTTASSVIVVHNSTTKASASPGTTIPNNGVACGSSTNLICTVTAHDDGTYTIT